MYTWEVGIKCGIKCIGLNISELDTFMLTIFDF